MISVIDNNNFNITFSNDSFSQTSVLRFSVAVDDQLRGNGVMYYCTASNDQGPAVDSNATLLTLAGEMRIA